MTMSADPLRDLELLLHSRYGLVLLNASEEARTESLLKHLAARCDMPYFKWSRLNGLVRDGGAQGIYGTEKLDTALSHISATSEAALFHLHDVAGELKDPLLVERLKAASESLAAHDGAIIISGTDLPTHAGLRQVGAQVSLPGPTADEFRNLVSQILRDLAARQPVDVTLSRRELETLVGHLSGLTLFEAEKILTKAIVEDGCLSAEDVGHIADAKRAVIEREGLLEYYPVELSMKEIADLRGFKGWLAKRTAVVADPRKAEEFGLTFPRGVLLIGVPGCGKSLSAKAVAAEWQLPLLRLDPSSLYSKYIGESEGNFKRAMETAERMAPVVLWVDELEKAFASGGSDDGGVSQRILGTFLSWMQERSSPVFIVATANNIAALPPELLRKGRFDEIFFVDLPDTATRKDIFEIHLRTRGHDPTAFDLAALAAGTDGFSGSEIEQVVVAALYTAFADDQALDHNLIVREIGNTRPLSITMAERVAKMRAWASGRAVPAN